MFPKWWRWTLLVKSPVQQLKHKAQLSLSPKFSSRLSIKAQVWLSSVGHYKHLYYCCQLWKGVNLKWPRIFLYWFHTCCGPLCRCRHPHQSCWVFPKILHPHSIPLPSSCSCWVWMSSVRTELTRPHYKPRWGQSQMSPSEGCSCLQSCFPVGKHFQLCKEGNNYFAILHN